jgi:hypothetical protein
MDANRVSGWGDYDTIYDGRPGVSDSAEQDPASERNSADNEHVYDDNHRVQEHSENAAGGMGWGEYENTDMNGTAPWTAPPPETMTEPEDNNPQSNRQNPVAPVKTKVSLPSGSLRFVFCYIYERLGTRTSRVQ